MSMYEGMFIFPKALSDESLEEVIGAVSEEITKLGGTVKSATRLGRRPFARPLKKQDSGHYAVIVFELDGRSISALKARYKLMDSIMRVQIVAAPAVKQA